MYLYVASDLHLEFSNFAPPASCKNADIIILAGDIWKDSQGIYWARAQWPTQEIVYITGNHEFYGHIRKHTLASLRIAAKENDVHFLENDEVIIHGIRFLGCTLWTDFELFGEVHKLKCMQHAAQNLYDFKVIHEGAKMFSPMDSVTLFEESYAFLKLKLLNERFDGQTVVITHHLPSLLSVAERYKYDPISACFASNIDLLLGHSKIWIHGHTHDSFDYVVRGTRVVCNPKGYPMPTGLPENTNFDMNLLIEL